MNELEAKSTHGGLERYEPSPFANPEEYAQPEEGRHLWDYVHVVLRRKWTVLTFFLVTVVTILIGTYLITPIYRATVILKTESGNPTIMLFKDQPMLWQGGTNEDIETQLKILKSKMLARRVIRAMGLDREKGFGASGQGRQAGGGKARAPCWSAAARTMRLTRPRWIALFPRSRPRSCPRRDSSR